jgi:hypothetical protein
VVAGLHATAACATSTDKGFTVAYLLPQLSALPLDLLSGASFIAPGVVRIYALRGFGQ